MKRRARVTLRIRIEGRNGQEELRFDQPPAPGVESLLEWSEAKSDAIAYGCRNGSCGTCMVEVVEGEDLLEAKTPQEEDTLSRIAKSPQSRLACRARIVSGADGLVSVKAIF